MSAPRKPTEMFRATVGEDLRMVLGAEPGVPEGGYRQVQLLVPESPAVHFVIDKPDPAAAGPARSYKTCPIPGGAQVTFTLQRSQKLYAQATEAKAHCTIIVEYFEDKE